MNKIKFSKTPTFKKAEKKLKKRYPSFTDDFKEFTKSLESNPEQGTPLAGGFRKIRMAITSKGKGKSGGARVITLNCLVAPLEGEIILAMIYDKSDTESVSVAEIRGAVKEKKTNT